MDITKAQLRSAVDQANRWHNAYKEPEDFTDEVWGWLELFTKPGEWRTEPACDHDQHARSRSYEGAPLKCLGCGVILDPSVDEQALDAENRYPQGYR